MRQKLRDAAEMANAAGYELFDHTADVGLRAFGKTIAEAFEHAARGLFAVIVGDSKIEERGEYVLTLESADLERLLVAWLSELLFLHETEGVIFSRFQVNIGGEEGAYKLSARVFGEAYSPEKHSYRTEVKAVTYHLLAVEREEVSGGAERWRVQVLLDI
jgi:SHS2 domain-containing protein